LHRLNSSQDETNPQKSLLGMNLNFRKSRSQQRTKRGKTMNLNNENHIHKIEIPEDNRRIRASVPTPNHSKYITEFSVHKTSRKQKN
jgi:hypothetical protein